MPNSQDFDDWLNVQKQKASSERAYRKTFIGERSYPHLDGLLHFPRIGHDVSQGAWLGEVVNDAAKLKRHGFLPFVHDGKRQRRFREPPHDYEFSSGRGERDQKLFPHLKTRPIMYASHRDACIFSYYAYQLQIIYEAWLADHNLSENVIAYRSIDGKNNVDFAKDAFDELLRRSDYDCLMLDVKSFFDMLDHALLKEHWEQLVNSELAALPHHNVIFDRITKYRSLNYSEAIQTLKAKRRPFLTKVSGSLRICSLSDYNKYLKRIVKTNRTGKGIPQGSPISGVLANIYLMDFDAIVRRIVVDEHGGLYQRYSDDIFIVCPHGKASEIYGSIVRALAKDRLRLGAAKTEIFRFASSDANLINITAGIEPLGSSRRQQIQYLGFHFDGKTITFRSSTLSKHLRGLKKPDYLSGAYGKTHEKRVARQMNKVRKIVKAKARRIAQAKTKGP